MDKIVKLHDVEKDHARVLEIEQSGASKIFITIKNKDDESWPPPAWILVERTELLKALDFIQ